MSTDGRTLRAERRRAETRERLLAAVATLLADGRGYADLSIEELAAEAQLSRSMFYAYFDDKGALMSAWLESVSDVLEVAAAGWWELDGDSTREDLRGAIAHMVESFRPFAPLLVAVHDAAAYDESVRSSIDGMLARSIGGLKRHIVRGQREGWIDPGAPAAETAAWLTCLAESGQHRIEQEVAEDELAALTEASADVIWRVLYAPAR